MHLKEGTKIESQKEASQICLQDTCGSLPQFGNSRRTLLYDSWKLEQHSLKKSFNSGKEPCEPSLSFLDLLDMQKVKWLLSYNFVG